MATKKGSTKKTKAKTPAKAKQRKPKTLKIETPTEPVEQVPPAEPVQEEPELEEGEVGPEDEDEDEIPHTDQAQSMLPPVQASQPPATDSTKKILGIPKVILLREPQLIYDEARTKVEKIIGKCTEQTFDGDGKPRGLCENTREIAPQDAFQVVRCLAHQKMVNHKKIAARRKLARAAAREARVAEERSSLDEDNEEAAQPRA